MQQALKSKEADRDRILQQLEREKVPDLQHLLEEQEPEEEIE
jgi:hypothetical protein